MRYPNVEIVQQVPRQTTANQGNVGQDTRNAANILMNIKRGKQPELDPVSKRKQELERMRASGIVRRGGLPTEYDGMRIKQFISGKWVTGTAVYSHNRGSHVYYRIKYDDGTSVEITKGKLKLIITKSK